MIAAAVSEVQDCGMVFGSSKDIMGLGCIGLHILGNLAPDAVPFMVPVLGSSMSVGLNREVSF